jgi:hypothetical protein
MKTRKSKSLKIIQHTYDSQKKGVWDGDIAKQSMYTELYIKEKYGEQLYYLDYVDLEAFRTYKRRGEGDDIYEFGITDFNKSENIILFNEKNMETVKPYIQAFKNTDKRYTFYPTGVYEGYERERITSGHSVFFLYDKKIHTVYLINSNGNDLFPYQKFITKFFELIYTKTVKIVYWIDCDCKSLGRLHYHKCQIGSKEDRYNYKSPGYCIIWTLWFLEMILTHPKLTIQQLKLKTNSFLEKKRNLICKIAISYAQYIEKITDKYELHLTKNQLKIREKNTNKEPYIITKKVLKVLGVSSLIFLLRYLISKRKKI